ncbi:MAG: hypothetical protein SFX73_12145 [Kofleriaceae bacterium]|nr:hypothetical protein [Kofleriaceae bacterium]
MQRALLLLGLAACGSSGGTDAPDAPTTPDAAIVDGALPDAPSGFGVLSGMCGGVLDAMDVTDAAPQLVRSTLTFARAFVDPADRALLTPGGVRLIETPNAGGSSQMSEVFAFEQLARCEQAALLKTETEIVYDTQGKITDLEIELAGHKVGVSVTRAVAFPFGSTYSLSAAMELVQRKLTDIQASTANVSAADRWEKQILAVLAWDDAAADTFAQAWTMTEASVKADTIIVITSTAGEDLFIYDE